MKLILSIFLPILMGTLARLLMLEEDYRQYYPNGYLIHLTTGFIAAVLGSVVFPALLFREIRKMEFNSLQEQFHNIFYSRLNSIFLLKLLTKGKTVGS